MMKRHMFTVKNPNKTYKTKNEDVRAITEMNISFPNKGLCFIMGKETGVRTFSWTD